MAARLNVVVTCTQRKTVSVPPDLRATDLRRKRIAPRAREWAGRLQKHPAQRVPAKDLYAGDAWTVVKELSADGRSGMRWWVCSAGYGLVGLDTPLLPYAATFSPHESDSVISDGEGSVSAQRRSWWECLSEWCPDGFSGPRSVTALAQEDPAAAILIVASTAYLDALEEDVVRARDHLSAEGQLSLLSAGARPRGPLADHVLPCDARFQARLGGARQSLNVRLLRLILDEHSGPQTQAALTRFLATESEGLPDLPTFDRQPVSDGDLEGFIRLTLEADPEARHTPALRQLRESGKRCEQGRFRKMFQQIKEAKVGS